MFVSYVIFTNIIIIIIVIIINGSQIDELIFIGQLKLQFSYYDKDFMLVDTSHDLHYLIMTIFQKKLASYFDHKKLIN